MIRVGTFALLMIAAAPPASARQRVAEQRVVAPAPISRVDSLMRRFVAEGRIAGAVTMVMQHGRVVQQGAYGMADREAGRKMTMTSLFRIASQSKAVTSVAAMMLVEEGRLTLETPVSEFIPSFRHAKVAVRTDSGRILLPVKRPITIRDLLTQTSGMSYGVDSLVQADYRQAGLGPAAGWGWYFADKHEPICATIDRLGSLPFVSQPGEHWVYGYSTDILGCVIERASGMPLSQFFRERIFQPLGMRSTYFYVPLADSARLTTVYAVTDTGVVRAPDGPLGQGNYVNGPRESFSGGAGLVSTAGDYARFLQLLLDHGTLGGTRLLSPATVALMTRDQVGDLYGGPSHGFGLGFEILEDGGLAGEYGADGRYGWGGAYGTSYWVDPANDLVAVMMIQLLPAGGLDLRTRFRNTVYGGLP